MKNKEFLSKLKSYFKKSDSSLLSSSLNTLTDASIVDNKITLYISSNYALDILKGNIEDIKKISSEILGNPVYIELSYKDSSKTADYKKQSKEENNTDTSVKNENPKPSESQPASTNYSSNIQPNPQVPFLNSIYTLDNFIPGDNSRYAYNIAKAIAANPASEYNPFLIYSNVGLGKTHLAEAIGNRIVQTLKYKVTYVTCEYFINEFMKSIRTNTVEQYKNIYRNVDVLIIDDVQFLEGRGETQNALFNIFNSLKDSNKQMIFTSDRPVSAIKEFLPRLSTRLNSGVVADLQPPSFETKVAILKNKCIQKNINVDDNILFYISENIQSNVRDLEACLNRLIAFVKEMNEPLTLENSKKILKDLIFESKDKSNITMEKIIKAVADYFNISTSDIRGTKKSKSINEPRHIAFYLSYILTECSTTEIGIYFGNRDHSTILHSINKIKNNIKTDSVLNETVTILSNIIKSES